MPELSCIGSSPNQLIVYPGSPLLATIIAVPSEYPKQEGLVKETLVGKTVGASFIKILPPTKTDTQP